MHTRYSAALLCLLFVSVSAPAEETRVERQPLLTGLGARVAGALGQHPDEVPQPLCLGPGDAGHGEVAAIEGNKLEIDFDHAGRKRVLDSFVEVA